MGVVTSLLVVLTSMFVFFLFFFFTQPNVISLSRSKVSLIVKDVQGEEEEQQRKWEVESAKDVEGQLITLLR